MPETFLRELPGAIPPSKLVQRIEKDQLAWPEQSHDDEVALQILLTDVERTEGYLVSRQFIRQWDLGDRLYYAYVAPINWPGTEVPRSALGMPLLATHLFSLLATIVQAFFSGTRPLKIDAREGTSSQTAKANEALIMWELEQCGFKQELVYFIFDLLLYGTGNMWWGFKPLVKKKRKKVWRAKQKAPVLGEQRPQQPQPGAPGSSPNTLGALSGLAEAPASASSSALSGLAEASEAPQASEAAEAQSAEPEMEWGTETDNITWVIPWVEYCHIRHYGVSPGCRRMDVRTSPYAFKRSYLSVEDLDDLRDVDGYQNIPPREVLQALVTPDKEAATPSPMEMGTFQNTINIGKKSQPRWMEATADPLRQGFEVIEYWTPDRVICSLERELCIRNTPHELGEIPSLSCGFQISPDSYYCLGLTHLVGNFQSVMQGVVNLYLDDMSLNLNGMFVTGKGYNSPGQAIWASPGKVVKVDDAQQFKAIDRQPVGADAMGMIEACKSWAAEADGAAEASIQGVMPAKQGIGRSATGASMMDSGTHTRAEFVIDNIADLVLLPLVKKFMELNFDNLSPEQIKQILGDELGHVYKEDPVNIQNGNYKVTISAGARLAARKAIAQQWPMIQNLITSPALLQGLQTAGEKLDYARVFREIFESAGYPKEEEFVIKMTPEDIKRMEQMNAAMNRQALQQQKIAQETDGQLEIEEAKAGGRALIQTLKHSFEVDAGSEPAFGGQ